MWARDWWIFVPLIWIKWQGGDPTHSQDNSLGMGTLAHLRLSSHQPLTSTPSYCQTVKDNCQTNCHKVLPDKQSQRTFRQTVTSKLVITSQWVVWEGLGYPLSYGPVCIPHHHEISAGDLTRNVALFWVSLARSRRVWLVNISQVAGSARSAIIQTIHS